MSNLIDPLCWTSMTPDGELWGTLPLPNLNIGERYQPTIRELDHPCCVFAAPSSPVSACCSKSDEDTHFFHIADRDGISTRPRSLPPTPHKVYMIQDRLTPFLPDITFRCGSRKHRR